MGKSIKKLLTEKIDKAFVFRTFKQSDRTTVLKSIENDFEVGLLIQKYKKRNISGELVDVGVRIPSVELLIDHYSMDRMQRMGFKNPEATGWLTLWRPTSAALKLQECGFHSSLDSNERESIADSIHWELIKFLESVAANVDEFRSDALNSLAEGRRPSWATMPSSSFLVWRTLALRKVQKEDWRGDIAQLIQNAQVEKPYDRDVEEFSQWLQSM